jgi:hypothetical protein
MPMTTDVASTSRIARKEYRRKMLHYFLKTAALAWQIVESVARAPHNCCARQRSYLETIDCSLENFN